VKDLSMKKVFIGLLALSLSLPGLGLWLPQSTLAQTQADLADVSGLNRLLQLAEQQNQRGEAELAISTLQKALLITRHSFLRLKQLPQKGMPEVAISMLQQALLTTRGTEAAILNRIGLIYSDIGHAQKALDYHDQALFVTREAKNQQLESIVLNNIGLDYFKIGQSQEALKYYNFALPIRRKIKDRNGEARTLNNIGLVYHKVAQPQKALEYYNQSLPIFREVKNRLEEAAMLNNIGLVYSEIGQPQKALEYYTQGLQIDKEIKDRNRETITLINIGWIYRDISQPQKALESFKQSLPVTKEGKNRNGEAVALRGIGVVYRDIGQPQKALEYYNQSLPIFKEVKDQDGEGSVLNDIGLVYSEIGQPQKALEYYTQALFITKQVKNRRGESATLKGIGLVYSKIGQSQKALEYFIQSLQIDKEVEDRNGEAVALNNIGFAYYNIDQSQKALEYYNQALPLLREVKNRNIEATTLNNIGEVYRKVNQPQKALEYFIQSLPIIREVKNRSGEAITLNNIGLVYSETKQPRKALEYYIQSLPIIREVKNRSEEAGVLYNISSLERSRGNLQTALTHIEAAIKIIETIRTEIVSQEFRTSYFASRQDYYDLNIDVLMQLHKQQPSKGLNVLALQASERARARSLLDLLNESQVDIRQGVDPKLLEQEKNLQFQLNALEKRRLELYSKNSTKLQIDNFEREYDAVFSQDQDLKTKIRSNSPRYAALTQPKPLTLAELKQQVLDGNTVLLEYFLGKDHSYLWAVTPSGMTSYELPKQTEIAASTEQFINLVKNSNAQPSGISQAGTPLSQMLLGPVAKQLGQKRLLIVSNGALQYLPFAALPAPTGSQSLLSEHEIINLPSASTLATLRHELNGRKPAAKALAVFADPVFSQTDQRVSKNGSALTPNNSSQESINSLPLSMETFRSASQDAGIDFGRLPGTRQEAENILKLIPANTQTQAFDFKASRENVLNSNLSQYRIIHFATHGILNTTRPELSAVVLSLVDQKGNSHNGFLRLNDVFNLNLPAELVVLSACQTGLGQNIRGEGLIGLTRGFMYAGTPRVLVSLWNVNDESTAVLMTHFYKAMLEQNLPPAAALRAAQLKMQQDPKWRSPYYWAAFTLQGEWK
jgi:CHAT domain-containing protein/Tfp pilus assembly protein PilF